MPTTPSDLAKRDNEICQLFDSGMSLVDLATEYALPIPRVVSLLRANGRLTVKKEAAWYALIRTSTGQDV